MTDTAQEITERGWQARFYTIWTGQTASLLGSILVRFALIWWLTETTGSAAALATASLAAMLPIVALGPLVGTLIDRWSRRWIMVIADGAIALFTALLAYLYWRGTVQMWHIYAILAVRALGTAFQDPAMTASTSLMVPSDQLTRVAGMNQTRQGITNIAGAPLGALLVTLWPIEAVLALDLVTAVLAIGPLLFIEVPETEASPDRGTGARGALRSVIREMVDGFRYVWAWPGLCVVVMTWALVPFFGQPAMSLTPLLIVDHFGGGPAELGWASSAFSFGSIVGGILMSTWGGFPRQITTILVGVAGYGLSSLVRGLVPGNAFWLYVVATFLGGPMMGMAGASWTATMQATIPPGVQGRVFSLIGSITSAMGPLGLLLLAPLADETGVQPMFLLRGGVLLVMMFVWMFIPSVRNLEDGPPGQTAREDA